MFAVGWVVVGKLVSRCGVSEFDEWIEEESEKKQFRYGMFVTWQRPNISQH
jgi:hypothetical protein